MNPVKQISVKVNEPYGENLKNDPSVKKNKTHENE